MCDELIARIERLESEILRLRAREDIIATFNQYLYALDTGYGAAILDSCVDNVRVSVINFPPDGLDHLLEGREAMGVFFAPYGDREPRITGGHCASNIAVQVSADATHADLSAYYTTTRPEGMLGGRYEATMRLGADGKWRFETLIILSTWGWSAKVEKVTRSVSVDRSSYRGRPATGFEV